MIVIPMDNIVISTLQLKSSNSVLWGWAIIDNVDCHVPKQADRYEHLIFDHKKSFF